MSISVSANFENDWTGEFALTMNVPGMAKVVSIGAIAGNEIPFRGDRTGMIANIIPDR